jgi:ABC-type antimicrobial peptide transport system permease subunit
MVLGQGLRLQTLALALGLVGAAGLTRAIGTQLVGVAATDPPTYAAVATLVLGVGALACWLPARRAAAVAPRAALG